MMRLTLTTSAVGKYMAIQKEGKVAKDLGRGTYSIHIHMTQILSENDDALMGGVPIRSFFNPHYY
jgi:hypothetical protein